MIVVEHVMFFNIVTSFVLIITLQSQLRNAEDDLLDLVTRDYAKTKRPLVGGPPVNVTVQIKLWTMSDIKEGDFSYEMSYILNTWWNDPRLQHNSKVVEFSDPPDQHIWYPELMVLNSNNNARVGSDVITRIYPNGDVHVNQRFIAKCVCIMHLSSYPMDLQQCPFAVTSYAYSSSHLKLFWHEYGVIEVKGFTVPGYTFEGARRERIVQNYTIGSEKIYWDVLEAHFHLRRHMSYHVFSIYIPCALLMVFNLGSYWIPHAALPGRIALLVTTFLTTTYILKSVSERTAKETSVTSLHIFTAMNLFFIVMAMVEYLLVLSYTRKEKERRKRRTIKQRRKSKAVEELKTWGSFVSSNNNEINQLSTFTDVYQRVSHNPLRQKQQQEIDEADLMADQYDYFKTIDDVHVLDEICRTVMPILYFCFCLTYFIYFLNKEKMLRP